MKWERLCVDERVMSTVDSYPERRSLLLLSREMEATYYLAHTQLHGLTLGGQESSVAHER